MDGECDLKQRCSPAATASLPLSSLINSKIIIDAPRMCLRHYYFFRLPSYHPDSISPLSSSVSAPSPNTQTFDATIEVDGVASVLSKSNLLLQGDAPCKLLCYIQTMCIVFFPAHVAVIM
jgi:hypothetical protein